MSMIGIAQGYCLICGDHFDEDITEHFAQKHPVVAEKTRTPIKSWQNRMEDVLKAMEEILQESDRATQIQVLDERVLKELYLVRANLAQMKRTKKKG